MNHQSGHHLEGGPPHDPKLEIFKFQPRKSTFFHEQLSKKEGSSWPSLHLRRPDRFCSVLFSFHFTTYFPEHPLSLWSVHWVFELFLLCCYLSFVRYTPLEFCGSKF